MKLRFLTLCISIQLLMLINPSFADPQQGKRFLQGYNHTTNQRLLQDMEMTGENILVDSEEPITCAPRIPISDRPDILQNWAAVKEASKLHTGDSLISLNGEYTAVVQDNGEIYVFDKDHQIISKVGTAGEQASSYTIVMQPDGNLVVYNDDTASPTWSSGTYTWGCDGNDFFLRLEDTGLLVLYDGNMLVRWSSGNNDGVLEGGEAIVEENTSLDGEESITHEACAPRIPISDRPDILQNWAAVGEASKLHTGDSLVSLNGEYTAIVQDNGEIYVFDKDHQIISKVGIAGEQASSYTIVMQPDGNLVIYNDDTASPTWSSSTYTWGCEGNDFFLRLEDTGLLVLYDGNMLVRWSSTYIQDNHEVFEGEEAVEENGEEPITHNECAPRTPINNRPDLLQNWAAVEEASKLHTGDLLVSLNRKYKAIVQDNGEIYVFNKHRKIISKVGIAGEQASSYTIVMQPDGNLVIYNDDTASPTWSSSTYTWGCDGNDFFLRLEDNGLLVLYDGNMSVRWSSTYIQGNLMCSKEKKN